MSWSRDPAVQQGCLRPGPLGPVLPLPSLLCPIVSLTPSLGLVTAGGPWASLRLVLCLCLLHLLFLPGSETVTFMPEKQPQAGEHSEQGASLPSRPATPCGSKSALDCQPRHSEALQSVALGKDKAGACHPSPPSTAQDFGTTKIYIYIFILGGVEKKAAPIVGPTQWQLLVP